MPYTPKTPPYEHQVRALQAAAGADAFAYLMEMGTGKTKTVLDEFGQLYAEGAARALVVVAPKGVYANWVSPADGTGEVVKHLSDDVLRGAVLEAWVSGASPARRRAQVARLFPQALGGPVVLVVNVEALAVVREAQQLVARVLRAYPTMMVVDESTTIKNHSAARTKHVVALGRVARWRRILTGSPITRAPVDLYSQFELLGPGLLGHRSWYTFRNEYCVLREIVVGGRSVKTIVGSRNLDKLARVMARHSFRVRKEECLDLPPKVYVEPVRVQMTPEQARVYAAMRDEAWAALEGGEAVTSTAVITQLLRLHQIACGHVTDDLGAVRDLGGARVDALCEVLDQVDGQAIVWATYRHDLAKIAGRLRAEYGEEAVVEYHGGVPQGEREEAVRLFQTGAARWFVGNQQTGGYGITLTAANTMVYYSNSYALDQRLQSEDRAHRIGQRGAVTYVDLMCEDTVDERIVRALRDKMDVVSAVLADGPRHWLV